jgi:para-aminobenzoate synthetase/4-amino-4-deoxychorismate lyase
MRQVRGGFGDTTRSVPTAQFDDCLTSLSTVYSDCTAVLETTELDEVNRLLTLVEQAAAHGLWAIGFISYDAAPGFDAALTTRFREPRPSAKSDATVDFAHPDLPLAWFGLFRTKQTEPYGYSDRPRGRYEFDRWRASLNFDEYAARIAELQGLLGAGDTYQTNLTFRLASRVSGDLFACYRDLVDAQGGAYNAYIDTGRFVVASASPELFFEWSGESLTARPMKGTVSRGRSPAEDRLNRDWLASSEKNQAENVMIVDLIRNDLGRVAQFGSVEVPELFALEQYETLWQMTSTVRAAPRPELSLGDIFRALFPSGSITGAPKYLTMEIIAKLESSARGLYCGAIGLVAPPGESFRAKFNVAIRTLVVDRSNGLALYGTGGGITIDSTPTLEFAEAYAKTAILPRPPETHSLIETMAVLPTLGVRNRPLHLTRLLNSAMYFGFAIDLEKIEQALDVMAAKTTEPQRLRLVLDHKGEIEVTVTRLLPSQIEPISLIIDFEPIMSNDPLFAHKTTLRNAYECRAARHHDVDDVLLVNERGEVTESTVANLVVMLEGEWWTPPLTSGCLPGVERARLIAQGLVRERVLYPSDVSAASRIGVVSSLRGFRRAALIDSPKSTGYRSE